MTELTPTPTTDEHPRIFADFETLGDALDYAAKGRKGFNFHDARATLVKVYPFSELREDALAAAHRLIAFGVKPGDRVALIADTEPQFCALFFGAVYAGALPVPLPLPTSFGGKESYVDQIGVQLDSCDPCILLFPDEITELASAAGESRDIPVFGWDRFAEREASEGELPKAKGSDIAYLQYSSGS
ncbi:MAG: AMP-binding protein, partial [Pseudomonadota bacterium]